MAKVTLFGVDHFAAVKREDSGFDAGVRMSVPCKQSGRLRRQRCQARALRGSESSRWGFFRAPDAGSKRGFATHTGSREYFSRVQ